MQVIQVYVMYLGLLFFVLFCLFLCILGCWCASFRFLDWKDWVFLEKRWRLFGDGLWVDFGLMCVRLLGEKKSVDEFACRLECG